MASQALFSPRTDKKIVSDVHQASYTFYIITFDEITYVENSVIKEKRLLKPQFEYVAHILRASHPFYSICMDGITFIQTVYWFVQRKRVFYSF